MRTTYSITLKREGKCHSIAFHDIPTKNLAQEIADILNETMQSKARDLGFYFEVVEVVK